MSFLRGAIIILLSVLPATFLWGQEYNLSGIVTDLSGRQPVEHAIVSIPELNYWTSADEKGQFIIKQLPEGTYRIRFQMMGYKDSVVVCRVDGPVTGLHVRLQMKSLALKEVVVTARENTFGSSSHISRQAIEHIQPKSIGDLFQLLPGHLSENPNLKSPKQIRIRDITGTPNAVGALLIVNDMTISNDGNMQAFSTSKQGVATSTPGTLGQGVDLRDIPAEDIESVEVIRGIPSAEYGNLTSGVVRVTSRTGKTPYRVNLKSDMQTKIASLQKGVNLPHNGGAMNAGFDYTKAYDDIRMKLNGYRRLTTRLAYANTFFRERAPLRMKCNFTSYATLDENKTDPDLKKDEVVRSKKSGFHAGTSGEWLLRRKWITSLEYSLSGSYAHVEDYQKRLMVISSGAVPFPASWVSGEFAADYLPGVFYSEYTMDGKPYSLSVKLKARLAKEIGITVNRLVWGIEYNLSGNSGKGLEYDIARPPMNVLSAGSRPRPFKAIPKLHNTALFAENRTHAKLGASMLTLQAGIRVASCLPGNMFSAEPRLIASYEIMNRENNNLLDRLAINAGWGRAVKMPPLIYLAPDNSYFDEVALNHLDTQNGSLAVVNTTVLTREANPDLKPMANLKREAGIDLRKGEISIQITFYSEKENNAYAYVNYPYIKAYRKFHVEKGGIAPIFEEGRVYYFKEGNKLAAAVEQDTVFRIYRMPGNNMTTVKRGVEYVIGLGKIEALSTSFNLDGAWMFQRQYTTRPYYSETHAMHPSKPGKIYPYLALMPAGESTVMKRLNTNIRSITHIPSIRMIFSLTTQIVWNERRLYRWDDEEGKPRVYYYDREGKRIDGSPSAYDYREETRHIDPVGFLDYTGTFHTWLKEYSLSLAYNRMVNSFSRNYYFTEESQPPLIQFNLRMTKEFNDHVSASFMVNNFFKMHPRVLSNRSGSVSRKNAPLYFGVELNIKI